MFGGSTKLLEKIQARGGVSEKIDKTTTFNGVVKVTNSLMIVLMTFFFGLARTFAFLALLLAFLAFFGFFGFLSFLIGLARGTLGVTALSGFRR